MTYEEIENTDTPPPEPAGGIPKQWLPGWIRWPLRAFSLPLILLDHYAHKLALLIIRPPYRQVGRCLKRGNCCHYILIPETKGIWGWFTLFVSTQIYGFYLRFKEPHVIEGKRIMVMGCRYLKNDGSCSHYRLRPPVCRKWPLIEHFGPPRILKGCGFTALPRDKQKKSPLSIIK